ncbi:short chain dehydrogenase [Solimonas fluminis]|uniref:Short chain dehydrogenase n=1 Tax=Solimonas fluminis TaxID=2086571 RepID=A0A2S5TAJ0_9GAMM|nr:SDR family NAD(P)-dependent oxidoreductase [Solimonas fluminis]PPE72023.1 short chain dehydrogenase [Solimonas fluminis]
MTPSNSRRILITGSASGIGLQAALQLAASGHRLVLADRNVAAGEAAAAQIRQSGGQAEFRALDLGDLSHIRAFADEELAREQPLDALINNAGLLPPMRRATTADGFERAFGVAYLGHYALTARLMPALLRSSAPRVVSVSSNSHPGGRLDFADLQLERNYQSSQAYTNSKLACLMFAMELQRRSDAAGLGLLSVAAHPGISSTPIAAGWKSENRRRLMDRFEVFGYDTLMRLVGQGAADGARPLVLAAAGADIAPGGYYGPTGFMQARGRPGLVRPARKARDAAVAARLWQESQALTGVAWPALG